VSAGNGRGGGSWDGADRIARWVIGAFAEIMGFQSGWFAPVRSVEGKLSLTNEDQHQRPS
jgi:hypothetical protein